MVRGWTRGNGRRPGIASTGANFRANAFAGSIETEDNGHPDTDMTPEQARQLKAVYEARPRSPEEAFNILFARVRHIKSLLEDLSARIGGDGAG